MPNQGNNGKKSAKTQKKPAGSDPRAPQTKSVVQLTKVESSPPSIKAGPTMVPSCSSDPPAHPDQNPGQNLSATSEFLQFDVVIADQLRLLGREPSEDELQLEILRRHNAIFQSPASILPVDHFPLRTSVTGRQENSVTPPTFPTIGPNIWPDFNLNALLMHFGQDYRVEEPHLPPRAFSEPFYYETESYHNHRSLNTHGLRWTTKLVMEITTQLQWRYGADEDIIASGNQNAAGNDLTSEQLLKLWRSLTNVGHKLRFLSRVSIAGMDSASKESKKNTLSSGQTPPTLAVKKVNHKRIAVIAKERKAKNNAKAADALKRMVDALQIPEWSSKPAGGTQPSQTRDLAAMTPREILASHGDYVPRRAVEPAPDPRAPFLLDDFQRETLDHIDAGRSVLMLAPTSSGKTFIAHYTLQKVLENLDDPTGMVLYVVPTEALLNQVHLTVMGFFQTFVERVILGRKLTKQEKKDRRSQIPVIGLLTMRQRVNHKNCRILITTPGLLNNMLFGPSFDKIQPKLRWIIFDEFHSLGDRDAGPNWESLFMMTARNAIGILGLSATIPNGPQVLGWMRFVQPRMRFELVRSDKRFSFLYRYLYVHRPAVHNTREKFNKLRADRNRLHDSHPLDCFYDVNCFTLIGNRHLLAETIARVPMAPRHLLDLHDVMCQLGHFSASLLDQFFSSGASVNMDALEDFKEAIFMRLEDLDEAARQAVRSELRLKLNFGESFSRYGSEIPWWNVEVAEDEESDSSSEEDIPQEDQPQEDQPASPCSSSSGTQRPGVPDILLGLLTNLWESDMLPAICFTEHLYDADWFARNLIKAIRRFDPSDEALAKYAQDWRDRNAVIRFNGKAHKDDGEEVPPMPSLPEFASFAPIGPSSDTRDRRDEVIEKFRGSEDFPDKGFYLGALLRGIGVHAHSLPTSYTKAVENLLRIRAIQVVFAGGDSLAYGVDLPIRTAVFLGNDNYLDNFKFQQMSGRAGRRGHDWRGHVVFAGIPFPKIRRLNTGAAEKVRGRKASLNFSLALRLLTYASQRPDPFMAVTSCYSRVSFPLWCFQRPGQQPGMPDPSAVAWNHQLFRFAARFFVENGFVTSSGQTLALAGLVSHIHSEDPHNLTLGILMATGAFEDLAHDYRKQSDAAKLARQTQLVTILAHFFCVLKVKAYHKHEQNTSLKPLDPMRTSRIDEIYGRMRDEFGRSVDPIAGAPRPRFVGSRSDILKSDYVVKFMNYSDIILGFEHRVKDVQIPNLNLDNLVRETGYTENRLYKKLDSFGMLLTAIGISIDNRLKSLTSQYEKTSQPSSSSSPSSSYSPWECVRGHLNPWNVDRCTRVEAALPMCNEPRQQPEVGHEASTSSSLRSSLRSSNEAFLCLADSDTTEVYVAEASEDPAAVLEREKDWQALFVHTFQRFRRLHKRVVYQR